MAHFDLFWPWKCHIIVSLLGTDYRWACRGLVRIHNWRCTTSRIQRLPDWTLFLVDKESYPDDHQNGNNGKPAKFKEKSCYHQKSTFIRKLILKLLPNNMQWNTKMSCDRYSIFVSEKFYAGNMTVVTSYRKSTLPI